MTTEELKQIRNIVREEVQAQTEPIKKDMATKMDIHEIAEDMAGFFHKTWEKLDETNERVTTIEDHLGLPRQKEN